MRRSQWRGKGSGRRSRNEKIVNGVKRSLGIERDWDPGNELIFDGKCKEETLGVVKGKSTQQAFNGLLMTMSISLWGSVSSSAQTNSDDGLGYLRWGDKKSVSFCEGPN